MGCVFAQSDQVEQARYGCCAFRFFGALRQSERHVVGDGAPGEQARFLKADSYAGVEAGHCLLADTHGTCGDAVQACCCTQEGGFAASGGADDGDNLAGGCCEGDSTKNFVGSAGHGERLSDVFEAEGDSGGGYGTAAVLFTGGYVSYCTVECHVTSIVPGVSTGAEESVPVAATSWSQVSQSLWMVCFSHPMGCGVPQSTRRARMNFYDRIFRIYHEIFRFHVTKRFFRHKRDLPPSRPVHSNHEIMSPGAKLWLAGRQPSPVAGCPR